MLNFIDRKAHIVTNNIFLLITYLLACQGRLAGKLCWSKKLKENSTYAIVIACTDIVYEVPISLQYSCTNLILFNRNC